MKQNNEIKEPFGKLKFILLLFLVLIIFLIVLIGCDKSQSWNTTTTTIFTTTTTITDYPNEINISKYTLPLCCCDIDVDYSFENCTVEWENKTFINKMICKSEGIIQPNCINSWSFCSHCYIKMINSSM